MTRPVLGPGIAVRYPGTGSAQDDGRPHICVLVSGITAKGDYLLIPICTAHPKCDPTCKLDPNKGWEVINRPSFAAYYKAKMVGAKGLLKRIEAGEITYLGKVDSGMYDRIVKGIEVSDQVEPWFLKAFQASK